MIFLDAVNRVLRYNGIIRGDTDLVKTFNDLQHGATLNLAIIAIQDTLVDLIAEFTFPTERVSGTITSVAGTRVYALPTDFVQFWDTEPYLYDSVLNNAIPEYQGGERQLKIDVYDYAVAGMQVGYPYAFYWVDGATKQIGLFPTPNTGNTPVLTFDYQKDISISLSTDTLPFQREIESQAFCGVASVRFKKMFEGERIDGIDHDPQYLTEKARLLRLVNNTVPRKFYGNQYK